MNAEELRILEKELWKAADQLRANSKLTATEYKDPVLGLIFLRHATNRFDAIKAEIEPTLPVHATRGKMALSKDHFVQKGALYLPEHARYDYLVSLPESVDIGSKVDTAMRSIEEEHESLKGVLPKNYTSFEKELLLQILRIFNNEVLQKASGDMFGRIYEYFLNEFAMTGAQEGGEFFTPMSLVQTIVNFIEPDHGIVFDPACGSAGMFVQTGHFLEKKHKDPNRQVIFYGQEKTTTNTNLAKMNMAVHGLEGKIMEGNSFYDDKHSLVGKCDFVMANPPFNVDGVDKGRDVVKKDARLPFGLPKNDNANYLWIQYFYSYLNPNGRAGFVMASSASDAGHSEKLIREKLVQTGGVDIMVAISNNFFYTRSLPCTLWFYDRAKENSKRRDKMLMLDARKVFRKVTTTINDFSLEQLENLTAIVKMYRGNNGYIREVLYERLTTQMVLLLNYSENVKKEQENMQEWIRQVRKLDEDTDWAKDIQVKWNAALQETESKYQDFVSTSENIAVLLTNWATKYSEWNKDVQKAKADIYKPLSKQWDTIHQLLHNTQPLLRKLQTIYKQLLEQWKDVEKQFGLKKQEILRFNGVKATLRTYNELHTIDYDNYKQVKYLADECYWLLKRFPDGIYNDMPGLCKVVSREEVAAKDYSLSPGRYVGVDTGTDADEDWEEKLQQIHAELELLNAEAVQLTEMIAVNYKEVIG